MQDDCVESEGHRSPRVAVVGLACLDVGLYEPPQWVGGAGGDTYTAAGLHTIDKPIVMGLGGNGATVAYVLGKLGLPVRLYTRMAEDAPGRMIRYWLGECGVDCVVAAAESTPVAVNASDAHGKRLGCLLHPGSQIDWRLSDATCDAQWLVYAVHSQTALDDIPRLVETMTAFKDRGGVTVLDTGIAWFNQAQPQQIHELWKQTDVLIGTEEELGWWSGCDSAQAIAGFALGQGCKHVVVKMDARGAGFQSRGESFFHQPTPHIEQARLSVGAGDSFVGALIARLAKGGTLDAAVTEAQQVASSVVEIGRGVMGWGEKFDRAANRQSPAES